MERRASTSNKQARNVYTCTIGMDKDGLMGWQGGKKEYESMEWKRGRETPRNRERERKTALDWVNEWVNERVINWTSNRPTERTTERVCEWMNERTNEWVSEHTPHIHICMYNVHAEASDGQMNVTRSHCSHFHLRSTDVSTLYSVTTTNEIFHMLLHANTDEQPGIKYDIYTYTLTHACTHARTHSHTHNTYNTCTSAYIHACRHGKADILNMPYSNMLVDSP